MANNELEREELGGLELEQLLQLATKTIRSPQKSLARSEVVSDNARRSPGQSVKILTDAYITGKVMCSGLG